MDKINGSNLQNNITQNILEKANNVLEGKDKSNLFSDKINNALKEVANTQAKSEEITKNYELGKEQDLTKVIVNQEISKLAFQLTLNVRNKVLSAYKDIMNMPV